MGPEGFILLFTHSLGDILGYFRLVLGVWVAICDCCTRLIIGYKFGPKQIAHHMALTDGTGDKYKCAFSEEVGHLLSLFVRAFDL